MGLKCCPLWQNSHDLGAGNASEVYKERHITIEHTLKIVNAPKLLLIFI